MKQCGTIEINKSKTQLYIKIIYYNWCIIEVISIINPYESNITSIIICGKKKKIRSYTNEIEVQKKN